MEGAEPAPRLIEALDELLLEIRRCLDDALPNVADDKLAADRLFTFAGDVAAALGAALVHLERTRSELDRMARAN